MGLFWFITIATYTYDPIVLAEEDSSSLLRTLLRFFQQLKQVNECGLLIKSDIGGSSRNKWSGFLLPQSLFPGRQCSGPFTSTTPLIISKGQAINKFSLQVLEADPRQQDETQDAAGCGISPEADATYLPTRQCGCLLLLSPSLLFFLFPLPPFQSHPPFMCVCVCVY